MLCSHMVMNSDLTSSSCKSTSPLKVTHPHDLIKPNYLPKSSTPNISHWGLGLQQMNLGRHMHSTHTSPNINLNFLSVNLLPFLFLLSFFFFCSDVNTRKILPSPHPIPQSWGHNSTSASLESRSVFSSSDACDSPCYAWDESKLPVLFSHIPRSPLCGSHTNRAQGWSTPVPYGVSHRC